MKRNLLFFLLAALLATVSCTNKHNFTINGKLANNLLNGQTIYLQAFDSIQRKFVSLDSVKVENAQFQLSGIASDTAKICFLKQSEDFGNSLLSTIIIEPGEITVSFGQTLIDSVGGTLLNNELQKFNILMRKGYDKVRENYQALLGARKAKSPAEVIEGLTVQNKLDQKEYLKNITKGIKPNMQNVLGEYLFMDHYYGLEPEQVLELVALAHPDFKANQRVRRAVKMAIAQATTAIGNAFAEAKGLSPEGKEIALSEFAEKGKIVLIDFWASWCGPCISSLPELVETYAEYKDRGFEIVGISLDSDKAAWEKAIKGYGLTWPHFSNLKVWDEDGAQTYGVNGVPSTVLIDKNGIIIERNIRGDELNEKLAKLLK